MTFDEAIRPAVQYAVENTMVCDNMKQARRFCFEECRPDNRVKTVTLQGQVISKGGTMTGGSNSNDDAQRAGQWDQKEFDTARAKKDELEAEQESLNKRLRLAGVPLQTNSGSGSSSSSGGRRGGRAGGGGGADRAAAAALLEDLNTELTTLRTRLAYARTDLDKAQKEVVAKKAAMKQIDKEQRALRPQMQQMEGAVHGRQDDIDAQTKRIQKVEDKVFAAFSKSVGVASIREYEEKRLAGAKDSAEKKRKLRDHLVKLEENLNFLRSGDVQGPLTKAKKRLKSLKAKLAKLEKETGDLADTLERCKAAVEKCLEANTAAQTEVAALDEELSALVADKKTAVTEKAAKSKRVGEHELKLEKVRAQRHDLLSSTGEGMAAIPYLGGKKKKKKGKGKGAAKRGREGSGSGSGKRKARGAGGGGKRTSRRGAAGENEDDEEEVVEDMDVEGGESSEDSDDDEEDEEEDEDDEEERQSMDVSQSQATHMTGDTGSDAGFSQAASRVVRHDDKKARAINYSSLSRDQKETGGVGLKYERAFKDFERGIRDLHANIEKIQPNMKALEQFKEAELRLATGTDDMNKATKDSQVATKLYTEIRMKRYELFMNMFTHVSGVMDTIYKDLTRSKKHPLGGNAYLSLDVENDDEPFSGGIKFTAMPPMKRFREMDQLSGGEKTVAALALLFAIHSYHPSPFFVMDEIDAALDLVNINKVRDLSVCSLALHGISNWCANAAVYILVVHDDACSCSNLKYVQIKNTSPFV